MIAQQIKLILWQRDAGRTSLASLFICFALSWIFAALAQERISMEAPSVEVDSAERILGSKEIAELTCTPTARSVASSYDGIVMESEIVTKDEKYGYIYRYDIVKFVVDDGSFHTELGTEGTVSKIEPKLVMYTLDCIHFRAAYHPMFELPPPSLE